MTYSPQVCLPGPATRARWEEGEEEGEWATRREDVKRTLTQRRRRGKDLGQGARV